VTEDQRQQALILCEHILETAAKIHADLAAAAKFIDEELGRAPFPANSVKPNETPGLSS
jgi:hypothetical protein